MSGYQTEAQRQAELHKPKLSIRIIEARGIKGVDHGGTADPFVEVRIKGRTQCEKTKVIKKTTSPFWDETFTLVPDDWEKDFLDLKLYDFNAVESNTLLGELELPVAVFVNRAPAEEWREVGKRHGHTLKTGGYGEVKLVFTYIVPGGQQPVAGYPPQAAYPGQYPPQPQPGYGYPPQQQPAYGAYPPPAAGGYPPQQPGYYPPPAQQAAYPPQGAYPPGAYPAQPVAYPPQGYPPQQQQPGAYPAQPGYPQYPPQGYPPQQGYGY